MSTHIETGETTALAPQVGPLRRPTLESGDRLTRAEFERRYSQRPDIKKAELIEGVVYVGSPVRFRQHGSPQANLVGWLAVYKAATPGLEAADNSTVRLDADNEPQPDGQLRVLTEYGGRTPNR